MKKTAALLLLLVAVALGAQSSPAPSPAAAGYERLTSLVGEWEGRNSKGKPVHAAYRMVSNGTVLEETLHTPEDTDMITVYHPDGNHLMMTYYCAANNQPRMRAEPAAGGANQLTFSFLDATNLASPADGHMHRLVVSFQDRDHFTQQWTWREKGQEKTEVFHFTRKK